MTPAPDAEPRPALRRPRLAAHRELESVLHRPGRYPVDKNNFQPRVGFAYSLEPATSVLRGGYGMFYEKQWIDRFENYPLNRVFTNSFMAQLPGQRRPIRGRATGSSRPIRSSSTGRR